MGKTALAISIAETAAKDNNHVLFFSLEMKATRLADRLLCGEFEVNPEKSRNGTLIEEDWEKLEKSFSNLENLNIHIFDDYQINIDNVRAYSRLMKKKQKCDLIIIDYLQLIDNILKGQRTREQEVAEISRRTKLLAMELNVPILLLAQLNRSCEMRANKKPFLSDLRESGAIEQDADMVCFIFRAEKYMDENDPEIDSLRGIVELIIAKNRNGRTGIIEFKVNESLTRIINMAVEEQKKIFENFNIDDTFPDNQNLPS